MLSVRDLHAYYGDAHAVQGASLTVREGEAVALLGRNGMGKTSLVRSIMGFAEPAVREGTVEWRGESLRGLAPHAIAHRGLALVPQGRRLFPSLTVAEHLTLRGRPRPGGWSPERIFDLFPRLAERRQHRGGQLSGGERGMLAVGRALTGDPQLLLMDEPSEGLSPVAVQHLEDAIARLKADGLGILLVEQNLTSALAVADRIYVLETGRVVLETEAATVARDPDALVRFLGVH